MGALDSPAPSLDQLDSDHGPEWPDGRQRRREQGPGRLSPHDRPEDQRAEAQVADAVQKAEKGGLRVVSGGDPEEEESREQARLEPGGVLHPFEEGAGHRLGQGFRMLSSSHDAEISAWAASTGGRRPPGDLHTGGP